MLASLPEAERVAILEELTDKQAEALNYDWDFWARPAQMTPLGSWVTWLILAGRGYGKMVADSTPIPTPDGWTTMGDLAVGDKVFDEAGRQCNVTAKFSPDTKEQYRLFFSDGSSIDACADHQWVTWTHAERKAYLRSPHEPRRDRFPDDWPTWRLKRRMGWDLPKNVVENALALINGGVSIRSAAKQVGCCRQSLTKHLEAGAFIERQPVVHEDAPGPKIRTTKEIVASLTYGLREDINHCIPNCGPLEMPEADLPIKPYTLGAWLGDGSSRDAVITCADEEIIDRIRQDGYDVHKHRSTNRGAAKNYSIGNMPRVHNPITGQVEANGSVRCILRDIGVKDNKHIPEIYLRSSIGQRVALLWGLMDTDGNVEGCNTVAFVNTNKLLIDAVKELVTSLGMIPKVWSGIGSCNGKKGKQFWRVQFTPTINPFFLSRKRNSIKLDGNQSLRKHHRMIVGAEMIDPVPMSCITVDSPNSMYLVGRAMIPTHNSRTGAEWIRSAVSSGKYGRLALVAETAADVRDVMIEGEAGILAISHPSFHPTYQPSRRKLTWPNGAMATTYSAEEPDQLRGPQHDAFWADEIAKWQYPDAWDQLMFGLRLGKDPKGVATTTPRPIKLIKDLLKDPTTVVTRGTTYENLKNLAPAFAKKIISKYEGTRLGRQELNAEVLDDVPGALWNRDNIDANRVKKAPTLKRIVVSIDPAVTSEEDSDDTGIVVAGLGVDGHGYILADETCHESPGGWAQAAVGAYRKWRADRIIGEVNNGGDLVEMAIRTVDLSVSYKSVRASRGKVVRAEPVAALCEQNKIHHVGLFHKMEDQMCEFTTDFDKAKMGYSPDRMEAMVWAFTELMLGGDDLLEGWDLS